MLDFRCIHRPKRPLQLDGIDPDRVINSDHLNLLNRTFVMVDVILLIVRWKMHCFDPFHHVNLYTREHRTCLLNNPSGITASYALRVATAYVKQDEGK
jgi:hypothetical protein